MDDWLKMINSIIGFKAKELEIFNFTEWLTPKFSTNKHLFMVNQPHVSRFTFEGIISKRYVTDESFSTWRGRSSQNGCSLEPFKLIVEEPENIPEPVSPSPLGFDCFIFLQLKLFLFQRNYPKLLDIIPEYAKDYFMNIFNPLERQYSRLPSLEPAKPIEEADHMPQNNAEEEFIVASISSRKYNKKLGMVWLVSWQGYEKKSWESKSSFVDDDGIENGVWVDYEKMHPHRRPKGSSSPARKKKKVK